MNVSEDLLDPIPLPWMPWLKLASALIVLLVVGFVVWKLFFADIQRRVTTERGGKMVAREQVTAEASIADNVIRTVHERDVYREHVTNIVREGQEGVNAADQGQSMDQDIDAAAAAGLCRLHDSLCRRSGPETVQPIRQSVPRADGARSGT